MRDLEKSIRLGSATIDEHRHVCAFFRNADEEYGVQLPFIKEGLERGEKAFHVVDLQLHEEHLRRLISAGIDAPAAEKTGQFELRNWHETYLRVGRFDEEKMLAFIPEALGARTSRGFRSLVSPAMRNGSRRTGRAPPNF